MKSRLLKIRDAELVAISIFQVNIAKLNSLIMGYPKFVSLVAVVSYSLIYRSLDAVVIFPAIATLNSMSGFLLQFSATLTAFVKIKPTLNRIDEFLKLPDRAAGMLKAPDEADPVLEVRGDFS